MRRPIVTTTDPQSACGSRVCRETSVIHEHRRDISEGVEPTSHLLVTIPDDETERRIPCVADTDVLDVAVVTDDRNQQVTCGGLDKSTHERVELLERRDRPRHVLLVTRVVRRIVREQRYVGSARDTRQVAPCRRRVDRRYAPPAQLLPPPIVGQFTGDSITALEFWGMPCKKARSQSRERRASSQESGAPSRSSAIPGGVRWQPIRNGGTTSIGGGGTSPISGGGTGYTCVELLDLLGVRVREHRCSPSRSCPRQDTLIPNERPQAGRNPRTEVTAMYRRRVDAGQKRRLPCSTLGRAGHPQHGVDADQTGGAAMVWRSARRRRSAPQQALDIRESSDPKRIDIRTVGTETHSVDEQKQDSRHRHLHRRKPSLPPGRL